MFDYMYLDCALFRNGLAGPRISQTEMVDPYFECWFGGSNLFVFCCARVELTVQHTAYCRSRHLLLAACYIQT